MPKSDTWPGGTGLETMNGMDSAGSCDSVVSANSAFSDDSLEHLSAEEKACLMFLEETIESLDTEEDSGLSNDEPDRLPSPGNLATKLADLSVSMSKSKLNGSRASKVPLRDNVDVKLVQGYLVPTPFVVANGSPCFAASTRPSPPPDTSLSRKPQFTSQDNKPGQRPPVLTPPPSEVKAVTPPPSTKPRDYSVRIAEAPLPRGPLSYEALVHLRRSASTKKTPLCPSVDHTIEVDNGRNLPRCHSEVSSKPKTDPPAVAPKPKKIPPHIAVKTQNQGPTMSDSSYSVKNTADPQVVRLEALQKLGLLKDQENDTVAPLPPPTSQSSSGPTPNRITRGPSPCNPSRSPSFCYSQVSTEPKNRPVQSSASFHHYSRRNQQPASHPLQSSGLKAPGLERSVTFDDHIKVHEPQHFSANASPPSVPQKPSNAVGYTVMVVPGMGADRKEALRKLGLLKQ